MFTHTKGLPIVFGYFPDVSSLFLPYSLLSKLQSSYNLDTFTFEKQFINIPIMNLQTVAIAGTDRFTLNNKLPMPVALVPYIQGQVCLATSNTVNHTVPQVLFSIKINIMVEFIYRN